MVGLAGWHWQELDDAHWQCNHVHLPVCDTHNLHIAVHVTCNLG
jgi:hypothetical protein